MLQLEICQIGSVKCNVRAPLHFLYHTEPDFGQKVKHKLNNKHTASLKFAYYRVATSWKSLGFFFAVLESS